MPEMLQFNIQLAYAHVEITRNMLATILSANF
jgi:hypothetical protein